VEVDFALLADAANVSREGKLNVLGVFDRIHGAKFPLTWPRMVLVTRFIASPAEVGQEKSIEIITLDADGKQLGRATGKMKIHSHQGGRHLKMNHVLPMGMTFPGPGQYSIEVLINGEPKATVPLDVVERQDQPSANGEQQAEP
jgi:hypothetical protein